MSIVWLGEEAASDFRRVGAKTARLSLLSSEFHVPPGFCLEVGAGRVLAGRSADGDAEAVVTAIREAYARLESACGRPGVRVAVRSTAAQEDSLGSSYAGQFTSVLNVGGADRLSAAVDAVLASAAGPEARAYRARWDGASAPPVSMAVLVQEMVFSDASAVAFTADPASGDRSTVVVESCWGLGQALVEGWTRPDRYRIARAGGGGGEVVDPGEKRWMAVAAQEGVRRSPVPAFLQRRPSLQVDEARAIAETAMAAERRLGWPVDLECALRDGRIHVLQCRPVTGVPGT